MSNQRTVSATLISHTPEPEKLIAAAGRLCYSNTPIPELMANMDDEAVTRMVNMLTGLGHTSTLEHASFTFAIEGVSRSLLAQITRHRIASFSVQSQRYVTLDNFGYIIPEDIESNPKTMVIFKEAMQAVGSHYERISRLLEEKYREDLEAEGMDAKTARSKAQKMAIENARAVLPNACETKMLLTMNARSLHNFFELRCCNRAQKEIRDLAELMLIEVKRVAPLLFQKAGPACLRGTCPEGAMSCGKINAMREKYSS